MTIAHELWSHYLAGVYQWRKEIEKGLRSCKNEMGFEDIVKLVRSRQVDFIESDDEKAFALIHPVEPAPGKRHIHILLSGGDYDSVMKLVSEKIEPLARACGATRLTANVRRGFLKRRPDGWHNPSLYVEKEI